jgi:hypothetical protein
MRSSGAFGLAILALTLSAAGCSASGDAGTPIGVDAGRDTGKTDGSVIDTGTTPVDVGTGDDVSVPTDTSLGDTKDAGPLPTCDQHAGDECNLVANNCPTNKMCDYTSANHNQCVTPPSVGPNADGDPCSDTNPCANGLFCQPTSATGTAGICTRACCPGNDAPCKQNGQTGSCKLNLVDGSGNSLYHLCVYNEKVCHPFKYDCPTGEYCIFSAAPDVFTCSTPAPGKTIGQAPGGASVASNDCGESQVGVTTKLADGGSSAATCRVSCWITKPTSFSVGTTPDGRFPANGTCTIGGTSYGTCQSIGFPDNTASGGGQLGVCIP